MGRKNELNKGLRALLSNIEASNNPEEKSSLVKTITSTVSLVPVHQIEVNPFQPRTEFKEEELTQLSQSILTYGLIQPITLRSLGGDMYQIISGERRWRASQRAGLKEIPAYIRVANDQEMLEMALVENIQRENLNAMEIAISYQRLMDECNLTHEALSDRVGKQRSTITNYVRLLKLPPQIQQSVKEGDFSMGHARALAAVDDVGLQIDIYKTALMQQLSVRKLEALVKSYQEAPKKGASKGSAHRLSPELVKIKDKISAMVGTKVDLKRDEKGKGHILIRFSNDKELNNILSSLDLI